MAAKAGKLQAKNTVFIEFCSLDGSRVLIEHSEFGRTIFLLAGGVPVEGSQAHWADSISLVGSQFSNGAEVVDFGKRALVARRSNHMKVVASRSTKLRVEKWFCCWTKCSSNTVDL